MRRPPTELTGPPADGTAGRTARSGDEPSLARGALVLGAVALVGCSDVFVLFPQDSMQDGGDSIDGALDGGPGDASCGDASCGEEPCRLMSPQCGCPCGEACILTTAGRECAAPGTAGPNERCETNSDCRPGLACFGPDGFSACTPYCQTGTNCAAGVCWGPSSGETGVCPHACDLAGQTGCAPGLDCISLQGNSIDDGRLVRSALCGVKAATGANGTDCTAETSTNVICGPGLLCANLACRHYCDLAAPECPSAHFCIRVSPTIVVGDIEYGACLPGA